MKIPNWLKTKLDNTKLQSIEDAIREAESTTSGEIVPMIVRKSSTIGHVPMILLSVFIAIFFAAGGPGLQSQFIGNHWAWYLLDFAGLFALTGLLSRLYWVERLLTSRADQIAQVNMRAVIEFYESNIKKTRDATGILLFVSLMERRAVVLADKAINDKVAKDTWQEVCDTLVSGIKKRDMGLAFCDAIRKCGEILTPDFPIKPDDENELQDRLIMKE